MGMLSFASGKSRLSIIVAAAMSLVVVSGCETVQKSFQKKPKKETAFGERISVLLSEDELSVDDRLKDADVAIPGAIPNSEWPQPGGNPVHAMQHLAGGNGLRPVWKSNAGEGSSKKSQLLSEPVMADGKVFVLDARSHVRAFDANTGDRLWEKNLTPEGEKPKAGFGGGLTYDLGKVFVATGFGEIVALDADNGAEVWKQVFVIPFRSAPTAAGGRLFINSVDNQLHAVSAFDGRRLWAHRSISEAAGVLIDTSPAVVDDVVIAPFSSGEITALRVENGRQVWSDTLVRKSQTTAMADINAITAKPIVDQGRVYSIGHSNRLAAIDLRSGERIWTKNIGGLQTPWLSGEWLFLVTVDQELICVSRRDGAIRWIKQLPKWKKVSAEKDAIAWVGPMLVGNNLLVFSSHGRMMAVSPYTGRVLSVEKLDAPVYVRPIVAGGKVYVLNDEGRLIAMEGAREATSGPIQNEPSEKEEQKLLKKNRTGMWSRVNPF